MKNILLLSDLMGNEYSLPDFFEKEKIAPQNFDEDIDSTISNYLTNLNNKEINSITLPISLSQNFLELTGIRVGHHIRLTKELKYRKAPLIFYGSLELETIAKISPMTSILFTPNVFYVNISRYSFDDIVKSINGILDSSNDFNFNKYLDFVRIEPPANYQSHHSIANDWALVRYFSMLEKDNENSIYNTLREKVSTLDYPKTLHFKFVESKADRQKFNPKNHLYTPKFDNISGLRIGIIDDESEKGWGNFYQYLIERSGGDTIIFPFQKDESKSDLILRLKEWINKQSSSSNPIDMFIVDLRLHDNDFDEINPESITGNQIIRYLKSLNKGIQIIVSTASNKVWNFQQNIDIGVTSYVVKESPETFNTREETRLSLISFTNEVDKSGEKIFLADIFRKIEVLKAKNTVNPIESDFIHSVFNKNGFLDKIFNLLNLDYKNDAVLNQCLLICFQILENYCDLSSVGSFGGSKDLSTGFIWKKDNTKFDVFINQPNNKILTWFKLTTGKFEFQENSPNDTIIGYNPFDKMTLTSSYKSGLDASSLVKMISVLHYREDVPEKDIKKIIELRYYRSNVSAHFTGRIKPENKITAKDDILFLINLFVKIFSN